jgi:thiopeptide-type bacteriocin biosynthesis protein
VWCAVAPARLEGDRTALRLEGTRAVTLPSPQWLLGLADRMLDAPGIVPRLVLTANNQVVRRGDRLEVEHPGPGESGQLGSILAGELPMWLLGLCASGAGGAEIVSAVVNRYPDATAATACGAVITMIRTGILLCDLLPEDLRADPLGHLLRRVPQRVPERARLGALRDLLHAADRYPPGAGERLPLLRTARGLADSLHSVERPITVDTLAEAEVRLPAEVGTEAARVASALWRISHRRGPLHAWSARFTTVYGHHRMVPLLEAIDPATGIGPPGPADAIAASAEPGEERARLLASLLADALTSGHSEIELTDTHLEQLEVAGAPPPRSAEIHLRVLHHLDGSFGFVVGRHAAQEAGSAAGRFARWLPQLAPTLADDAESVVAEIVCRPLTFRTGGLAAETRCVPHRIPVGVPTRDGDLHPGDLAILAVGRDVLLWSHAVNKRVVPVLFSRVTRALLPPVARLLHLLGHAGEQPWHTWSWGVAASFPYTPRVSYRGTILAPQRWLLPGDLVTAAHRRSDWQARLAQWLTATRPSLPGTLVTEESDRHLPLHLHDVVHQEILRRSVLRGTRTLSEAIGHGTHLAVEGPHGRHPLELVVALHRRASPPAPRVDPRTAPRPATSDTLTMGDSDWLSVALPVPVRLQNAVLRRLPAVPAGARFFWLRYDTPALGPHLRLRYHADRPGTLGDLPRALGAWAADIAEQRLSNGCLQQEPYVRETQRYGGPDAIHAAEDVFAADSALVLAALSHPMPDDEHLMLAAHCAAAIARSLASPGAARGGPLTSSERHTRDRLRPPTRAFLPPHQLTAVWDAREARTTAYRSLLATPRIAELCASDLIHLHCNRLLGASAGHERIVRSLATDLLHRGA